VSRQQPRVIHALPVLADSRTVAAVGPDRTFAYSDADWQKIKASLARVSIDADAETVGDRWWARPDPATALTTVPQRPLCEQLQELAADYRGLLQGFSLTPKYEAARIRRVLDALERSCHVLNSSRVGFVSYAAGDMREAVRAFTVKAKRHLDKLMATGSRSSVNARKVHIAYWGELVLLWQTITNQKRRRQRRRGLSEFLLACSAPAFPEATTKSSITSFLSKTTKRAPKNSRRLVH
jgi:hypothetical protein